MSKLPEKLELETETMFFRKSADNLNAMYDKINEIIKYLEQYEQQKPLKPILSDEDLKEFDEASNHDEDCYCDKCKKWHELVGEEV